MREKEKCSGRSDLMEPLLCSDAFLRPPGSDHLLPQTLENLLCAGLGSEIGGSTSGSHFPAGTAALGFPLPEPW